MSAIKSAEDEVMMLRRLKTQVDAALSLVEGNGLVDMTQHEQEDFQRQHPGAILLLGEFEIRFRFSK